MSPFEYQSRSNLITGVLQGMEQRRLASGSKMGKGEQQEEVAAADAAAVAAAAV